MKGYTCLASSCPDKDRRSVHIEADGVMLMISFRYAVSEIGHENIAVIKQLYLCPTEWIVGWICSAHLPNHLAKNQAYAKLT